VISIVVNMIVEWLESDTSANSLERVLWCDPGGEAVIMIPIQDSKSLPIVRTREEIEAAFAQEAAIRRTLDPFAAVAGLPPDTPAKHLEIRDRAWIKICSLVNQEPDIYFGDRRKRLIMNDPEASKGAVDNIYKYLCKYWKRGMTKNALLPDFNKCGGSGKERAIKEGCKRGRKPKVVMVDPTKLGVNVDKAMREIFNIAIKQFFNTRDEHPLRRAYAEMRENYFNLGYREQGEVRVPIMPAEHEMPTYGQFAYWHEKQKNLVHSIVSRKGRRAYELRHRPLLGNSTKYAFGPGSIFQVDATIADVYLVAGYDRSRIIGRPVVYFCVDVFSRLCVGLYVGLEGPSWLTGMMALANSTTDKVSFCAEYGIEISAEDWPCGFLPEQITADRGEFIGISSDNLVDNLNISFANCPPYRGDLKGIVERSFRRANDTLIKWVPGAVRKREQGDPDYRLEAKLTIHEFTRVLILMVIEYNLFHRLDHYPLDRDMISDGVEPVPIELWNWGIANRSGHLRERSPDTVKLALLPRVKATITCSGIQCNGMFYSCERAISEQWFIKARQGRWSVEASHDPRRPETIYLNLGNGRFESCNLLPRESRYKDLCLEEIQEFHEVQKQKSSLHKSRRTQSLAEFHAFTKATIDQAIELSAAAQRQPISKNKRTSNIRLNRREGKEHLRQEEAWDIKEEGRLSEVGIQAEPFLPAENIESPEPLTASSRKKKFLEVIERVDGGGYR